MCVEGMCEPRRWCLSASSIGHAIQALWCLEPLRNKIGQIARGSDPILSGVQMLMTSLFKQITAAPLALLRAALPPRILELARSQIGCVSEVSEAFEATLSLLSESSDRALNGCLDGHFCMSMMEMCECACGELLEPLSYTAAHQALYPLWCLPLNARGARP